MQDLHYSTSWVILNLNKCLVMSFKQIQNLFRICTINYFALGLFLEQRLRNGIHPKLTPLTFFYVIYLAAGRLQWDLALRTGQLEFQLVGH